MEDQLAQLNKELQKNSTIRCCGLKASIIDGHVIVIGRVYSYHQKQIAIHVAQKWANRTFLVKTEIVVEPRNDD